VNVPFAPLRPAVPWGPVAPVSPLAPVSPFAPFAPAVPVSPLSPFGPGTVVSVPAGGTCGIVNASTGRPAGIRLPWTGSVVSVRTNFALIVFAPKVNSSTAGIVDWSWDQATHGSASSRPS
jgi:hypothetical protein